jgi:hypothetical protein
VSDHRFLGDQFAGPFVGRRIGVLMAIVEMEIISNGFITDPAREFLEKLPTVDHLIPPLRVEELAALLEGQIIAD